MARTPIHPGGILADELEELGISASTLARELRVPPNRITKIISGKRSVSADTAIRLGRWFGNSPEFWLNLQKTYELDSERRKNEREYNDIAASGAKKFYNATAG